MMREALIRIVLVVTSSLLALFVAEGTLRLYLGVSGERPVHLAAALEQSEASSPDAKGHPTSLKGLVRPSRHPEVVYELKPGLAATFKGKSLRVSSQGLRDREYDLAKPAGTYRIVGLGDSEMFGWGVEEDESFLGVLERRLGEAGGERRFEVLDFAVPGYNTALEVAVFEHRALAFEPDLVVIQFINNDLRVPHFMMPPRDLLSPRRAYLLELLAPSLGFELSGSGDRLLSKKQQNSLTREEGAALRGQYRYMAGEDGYRRAMARLAELTVRRGVPVIVLRLLEGSEYHELVDAVAAEHGLRVVVAQPYYHTELERRGLVPDKRNWQEAFWLTHRDSHPNVLGHELLAEALWDELAEIGVR